jgi:LuxR family maltose regulon positive regulatory protein
MVDPLRTNLFVPRTLGKIAPRPRPVERLAIGLDNKLTLISALAGFGKATLVVARIKQIDLPAAWLPLDEADNDQRCFLTHLAARFHKVGEGIGAPLLNALQSPQLPAIKIGNRNASRN